MSAQIHNDDDDVILIKYRDGRLFADADRGDFDETLDDNYRLGTRFKLRIQATQGEVRVTYNDTKTVVYEKSSDTMYFKAGAYNQSNLEKYPDEVAEFLWRSRHLQAQGDARRRIGQSRGRRERRRGQRRRRRLTGQRDIAL